MNEESRDRIAAYAPLGHKPEAVTQKSLLSSAYKEMIHPYPSIKLPRFPKFNLMTGGLRAHEYTIICGSTGVGKTSLMANISAQLSEVDVPHYVASIETGPKDFIKRVMSAVRSKDWNTGDSVGLEEIKKFHVDYGAMLEKENVWLGLYENRVKMEVMLADLSHFVLEKGIQVAIIDNFNFMTDVTSSTNQVKEEDRVIHEFIMFCKAAPIHIIMIHHPKKTDTGRVDSEFDIKGSSTGVQEAQNVLLWNKVHPSLVAKQPEMSGVMEGDRELTIAKMRRRGKYVGRKIIFRSDDGVSYREVGVV